MSQLPRFRTPDLHVLSDPLFWKRSDARFLMGSPIADWDYETCKAFVHEAVHTDAPPSMDLVAANARLVFWEAELGISEVSSFPFTVSFPLTDVCNARCAFCAYIPERVVGRNSGIQEFEKLDWLKFVNTLNLNCGLGEPLMHRDFAKIVQFLRRTAPHLRMSLITNASKLSEANVDAVVDYFAYLKVSMNAARKETYEETMKIPWQPTIDGLKLLKRRKEETGARLPAVRLSFVLHRKNLEEIVEAPALAKELGADEITLANMVPVQKRWSDRYDRLMDEKDVIESDMEKALPIMRQFKEECFRQGVHIKGAVPLIDDVDDDYAVAMDDLTFAERKKLLRGAILKRDYSAVAGIAETVAPDVVERAKAEVVAQAAATPPRAPTNQAPANDEDRPAQRLAAAPEEADLHLAEAESAGFDPADAVATSTGFVRQVAAGFDPTCIDPWKNIRVGIRNEISPCCMFAGGLPPFDWNYATGRTFHDPRGTWNSPPLQLLRRTMNKPPEEMPFCSGCRTSHKQDPGQRSKFRDWKRETLARLDQSHEERFNGSIQQAKGVSHVTYADIGLGEGARAVAPVIPQDAAGGRRRIDSLGLRTGGAVAYVGPGFTEIPFLAEANDKLIVMGSPEPEAVKQLAERFELTNVEVRSEPVSTEMLAELKGELAGAIIDGRYLADADRAMVLKGVGGAIVSGGTFALLRYAGPAKALQTTARAMNRLRAAETPEAAQDRVDAFLLKGSADLHQTVKLFLQRCVEDDVLANRPILARVQALVAGPGHAGPHNFTTGERLRSILAQFGLRVRDDWVNYVGGHRQADPESTDDQMEVPAWEDFVELIARHRNMAASIEKTPEKLMTGVEFMLNARGVRR